MSSLIVEVKKIDNVISHPNADRLEIAQLGGWQCVIKKKEYVKGDLAVFIPPDYVVPKAISDQFGFTQYTSNGRVKFAKLRGEPSHGVLINPEKAEWTAGTDVAEHYGITKYVASFRSRKGGKSDQEKPHPLFIKYTGIENLRHHMNVFVEGEEVIVTEKIHGSNCRIGLIDGEQMAGSKNFRRKPLMKEIRGNWFVEFLRQIKLWKKPRQKEMDYERWKNDWYWSPWLNPQLKEFVTILKGRGRDNGGGNVVMVFGETFGADVQKGVSYGSPDKLDFAAFDAYLDGKYVDWTIFQALALLCDVKIAPVLYQGPYNFQKIVELSKGKTIVNTADGSTAIHIREGVIVKPVKERHDPRIGRVILKYVSDDYLLAKETGDFGDEDEDVIAG